MNALFASKRSLAVEEFESAFGLIRIYVSPLGVIAIDLPGKKKSDARKFVGKDETDLPLTGPDVRTRTVRKQLEEYFKGKRRRFDLPVAPHGAEFDRKVWARVAQIPYAAVVTYGDIARDVEHPKAFRAVGAANGRNPIPLVIPCHRVVGADRRLTGFYGGVALKAKLLALEGLAVSDKKPSADSRVLAASGN